MGNGNWFGTGYGAVDKATNQAKGRQRSFRFYIKPEEEKMVVFLDGDDTPEQPLVTFWEHEFTTQDGEWRNFATCVKGNCLLCEKGVPSYFAGAYSIVEMSEWKEKDGTPHRNTPRLLIAKLEFLQKLRHLKTRKNGLMATVWNVYRTGKKSYTVGDDWQFEKRIEPATIEGVRKELALEKLEVYDYKTLLAPKTREELLAMPIDWAATAARRDKWGPKKDAPAGDEGASPRRARTSEVDYK